MEMNFILGKNGGHSYAQQFRWYVRRLIVVVRQAGRQVGRQISYSLTLTTSNEKHV